MRTDLTTTLATSVRALLLFTLLTGVIYPAIVTAAGQLLFPSQAAGSLLVESGRVVGSKLIGQDFSSERYFWLRPSASAYGTLPAEATNFGPTSAALKAAAAKRRATLGGGDVPPDLLTSSASGLDPDISPAAAAFQITRVAQARHLDPAQTVRLRALVERYRQRPQYGFFGMPRVNVLALNLALDKEFP